MRQFTIRERRWRRQEYDRLIELGIFGDGEPIELIAGHLLVAEPQDPPQAKAIELAADALRAVFAAGWRVRVQLPLALDGESEPEPDLAVVRGSARDRETGHPRRADLLVEVAGVSLRLDRGPKAAVYARAGIVEYWIVNVVDRVLEVYRAPQPEGRRWKYGDIQILGAEASVSPLAAPSARIAVADLLP